MAVTGRTGADALARAAKRQQIVLTKYAVKFQAVVDVMHDAALLTDTEYTLISVFITTQASTALALYKIAAYSGF